MNHNVVLTIYRIAVGMCIAGCWVHAGQCDESKSIPLTVDSVAARFAKARKGIHDLQIRIREHYTPASNEAPSCDSTCPRTREIIFAFSGNKRYLRRLSLDDDLPQTESVDATAVFDDRNLYQRKRNSDQDDFRSKELPKRVPFGLTPAPEYLRNTGYAVPDTTASDPHVQAHLAGDLAHLLQAFHYDIDGPVMLDGTPCVTLEGRIQLRLPALATTPKQWFVDKLWLDSTHNFAVRKRELITKKRRIVIVNSRFEAAQSGLWLPRHSTSSVFTLEDGGRAEKLLFTRDSMLRLYVLNQTPDLLFELLNNRQPSYKNPRAYHWRMERERPRFSRIEEGWSLEKIGRRVELTEGNPPRLVSIVVDAPEVTLRYDVKRKQLQVSRSEFHVPTFTYTQLVHRDPTSRTQERLTALIASTVENRAGRDAEKMTYFLPTDPLLSGRWPIHVLNRSELLESAGSPFRKRIYFWDRETGFSTSHICGCSSPKHGDLVIDYPDPENLPKNLLFIELPADAEITFRDSKLRQPAQRYIRHSTNSD